MKLKTLISEYLEGMGQTEQRRRRAYTLAVDGLREMSYDHTAIIEVKELIINDADTANLPDNYINLSRIGICGGDGQIHSFASNNNICLNPVYNSCGQPIPHPITQTTGQNISPFLGGDFIGSQTYIASHYRNGENVGGFFGRGGGQEGTYRINQASKQIQFGALPPNSSTVVLEYLGDLKSVDNDFEVHPFMILALKRWIDWNWLIPTDKAMLTREAELRYNKAYMKMVRRFNSEPVADWLNAFRRANTASVKF